MWVEVAYGEFERQILISLRVDEGCLVGEAIARSGMAAAVGERWSTAMGLSIWGSDVTEKTVLRSGDRVEVHRALEVDPKTARRRRAGRG